MSETLEISAAVEAILLARRVPMAYQPIVDLVTRQTVAYEALARPSTPPGGTGVPGIVELLAGARSRGVLAEVDWICRVSALSDPAIDDLPPSLAWFVNAEPSALATPPPPDLRARSDRLERVVLEVTERELHADPHVLLTGVAHARRAGLRVALDDVGTEPRALALLAVIAPDVVKLDASLLRRPADPATRQVTDAVRAYCERTGAAVIAEGVEGAGDVEAARVLGATHGQGFHLGRPGLLPRQLRAPVPPLPRAPAPPPAERPATPFEILSALRPVRRATRRLLAQLTRHLEDQVGQHQEPLALLVTFQHGDDMSDALAARYRGLALQYAFVAMFGPDLADLRDVGVAQVELPPTDPLLAEWTVVVIGPHYGCALSARATGLGHGDEDDYDHVVTHDRDAVEQVARAVLGRMPLVS